jgi:uncharacterized damage-inducible protein DinB
LILGDNAFIGVVGSHILRGAEDVIERILMMPGRERSVFTLEGVRKFHGWTHASLTLLLDHLSTVPTNDYVKDLPDFGFSTLRKQVIHIFNCEGFWIHTLQGLQYADRNPTECPAVADARLLQQEVSRCTQVYLSSQTNEQLNADTELHFSDGDRALRTPALVLYHVLTHAFHHKGQIVAMCRGLGHPAPDTDLNQFE